MTSIILVCFVDIALCCDSSADCKMYRNEDEQDLRNEIFHLKKQLSNITAENHLLKVRVRKLQNEVVKKDKQMDAVLDPRNPTDIRKILYERSASFIINMKEKNDRLQKFLREKDIIIKRLQSQLEVTKLYSQPQKKQFHCTEHADLENKIKQIRLRIPCHQTDSDENGKKSKHKSLSWTPGIQEVESTVIENVTIEIGEENPSDIKSKHNYDIKDQYKSLSREHLLSIIENLKNNQRFSPRSRQTSSRKSSPESDLDRIELLCESPHEEIQQLHSHFLDMLSEVDHLKSTIVQLQNNQEKTDSVLKKKDTNIDKLAQEIKNLKRPKSRNNKVNRNRSSNRCNSSELISRIYSSNNSSSSSFAHHQTKNEKVLLNRKSKSAGSNTKMKDVMTQVEKIKSNNNHCMYVEKGSLTITQKSATSQTSIDKESEYDEEVFDEEQ